MKKIIFLSVYLLLFLVPGYLLSQTIKPLVKIPIYVEEGNNIILLEAGIDSLATDSIDTFLGEEELPPLPPSGVFDARFTGRNIAISIGNGSLKDFRYGIAGEAVSKVYQIAIQKAGTANTIIRWDMPEGISGHLQDLFGGVVVNKDMIDSDSCIITNNSITELRLEINFNTVNIIHDYFSKPLGYKLYQNYPNPFNPVTNIKFEIPEAGNVSISIFDSIGEKLSEIFNQNLNSGMHEIKFNAGSLSSGIYFYKLKSGRFVEIKKMIIIK